MNIIIKLADENDIEQVSGLAHLLWGEHDYDELRDEMVQIIRGESSDVFIAYADDAPVGFIQCSIRNDYVEGTESSPVGYIEGIYVRDDFRRKNIAARLVDECAMWAKERGCSQLGSDCELSNDLSIGFHTGIGFTEANRIVCFVKDIK